jgi:hypothetical protein
VPIYQLANRFIAISVKLTLTLPLIAGSHLAHNQAASNKKRSTVSLIKDYYVFSRINFWEEFQILITVYYKLLINIHRDAMCKDVPSDTFSLSRVRRCD